MVLRVVSDQIIQVQSTVETRIGDPGAGNYSGFETDGTLEFNGNATVWDDLRVPGTAVARGSSAPDLESVLAAGNLEAYAFDGGATMEQVFFQIQMPHSWAGTAVYPHVHWMPSDGTAGSVVWQLEYSWTDIDQVFPAVATDTVTDAAAGVAWTHQLAAFSSITPSATQDGLSSMLICRLFRDPTHGSDDYGSDAILLEFDIHYEIDTVGSRQATTK